MKTFIIASVIISTLILVGSLRLDEERNKIHYQFNQDGEVIGYTIDK